ncbi:MAG: Fe-S protein assembly co-chaperone HscB [Nitrospirales bacterium]|nr:Fe-S protein assembly co-chaperone HscB [Nitrospira sp.]MDR4501340.1 Fe-S protein assembly co-chaperone HscB [Nitrospirales bacterium]
MDHEHGRHASAKELPMARSMCWHCQSEVKGEYLCGQCVKVQPLSKDLDYFTCMRLPRLLSIDQEKLQENFYDLSRTFHPDFYSDKDEQEQTISLGNSALLNTAYRTLKDPIQRAEYLIRLEAGAVKEIRSTPPADLFDEILELQEDLEEYRALSSHDQDRREALRQKLNASRETLEQRQAQMESSLKAKFGEWDAVQQGSPDSGEARDRKEIILKEMREILSDKTYVRNIVNDLIETTS